MDDKVNPIKTPECDKIIAHKIENQTLSAFVDWLNENGYAICSLEYTDGFPKEQYPPIHKDYEHLFAEYFNIDLNICEQERRAILEAIRGDNL
jgi:hypothetical protein